MAGIMEPWSIVNTAEFSALPEESKNKLHSYFDTFLKEKELLKSNLEKTKFNFEQKCFELEESNSKLENSAALNRQQKEQLTELEKQYEDVLEKLKTLQESHDGNLSTKLRLMRVNEQLEFEKLELTSLLEKRNREINHLNEELKLMSLQVFEMNTSKCDTLAKLDEMKGSEVSREFQVKWREQEVQNLQKQIEWLNKEMNEKTKEFMTVKNEKSTQLLDVQSQLDAKIEECNMQRMTLESQRTSISNHAQTIDSLIQRINCIQDTNIQSEEQYKQEIQARMLLADLYETSALEAESKSSELFGAVTELQKLLQDAAAAHTKMENEKDEEIQNLKEEIEKREHKIENIKQELVNANELLSTLKSSGASEDRVEAIFQTSATTSIISGMTLTQIYNEYIKSSELLILEKEENKRLNMYLDQILQEIEEKAPMLEKQREDYEIALKSIDQMTRQLDGVMLTLASRTMVGLFQKCQTLQNEADENHRKSSHLSKENQKQNQQLVDLSEQIKYLVKEIEELRGRRRVVKGDVSSLEISSSSSKIISERLVTFGNIDELLEQNQRLLTVIRELSENQEMEESSAVDSKTRELREQLDKVKEELAELKESRLRQVEIVESIVQQRDMYRALLQQANSSPSPISSAVPGEAKRSPRHSILQSPDTDRTQKIEEKQEALQQLQAEFMSYKKEKLDNEKVLNEQLDKARQDISDLRVQNAKLASQLDFASEKKKVLQGNIDGYKKEIALLQEKSQKCMTSVAKHEQSISSLTKELMSCQEQLSQAGDRCENLRSEKELIRSSEQRLQDEIDHMKQERQTQTTLIGNLQAIQSNLERSENETKYRLNKQIEALEREKILLTKKLEMKEKQQASITKQFEDVWSQLNLEKVHLQSKKDALNTCNQELQETKQQLSTVTTKLENAESEIRKLIEEKKCLLSSLAQAEAEVDSLKIHLLTTKQQVEQYKTMAECLQQTISAQNEASDHFKRGLEDKLFKAESERNELKIREESLEKERQKLLNEKISNKEESQSLNAELCRNLATLQNELQEALELKETASTIATSAQQDCAQQAKLAADAQCKYEQELMLHSLDVAALSVLKKKNEGFNAKLLEKEEQTRKAEQELAKSKASFEQKEKLLKEERDKMAARVTDLMQETRALHLQMDKLSHQLITNQERSQSIAKPGSKPMEDDSSKSSIQLLDDIIYLRKAKDIAEGNIDMNKTECTRLNQRCDMLEEQLKLANANLAEERQKLQAVMQTTAQQAELMHRSESYHLLQDSNKLLREERDHLQAQLTESESKLYKQEEASKQTQSELRDLLSQKEGLVTDNTLLMAEMERWKNRTNHLIEESHKTDPEENKRLIHEKEELRKHVFGLTEELNTAKQQSSQMKEEMSKQSHEKEELRKHVFGLTEELNTAKQQSSQMKEEMSKQSHEKEELRKHVFGLTEELKTAKQQTSQMKEEMSKQSHEKEELRKHVFGLTEELNTANHEKEELRKHVFGLTEELNTAKRQSSQMKEEMSKQSEQLKTVTEEKEKVDKELAKANEKKEIESNEKAKMISQIHQLQSQIQQLHKQIESNQKNINPQPSVLVSRAVSSAVQDRTSSTPAEAPKTANIRPIASSPASIKPQTVPIHPQSVVPRVTASIRPMAIAPTSSSPIAIPCTPTATVMPTTVPQQENIVEGEMVTPIQQLFPQQPLSGIRPMQQVQGVIPTQESSSQENVPEAEMFTIEPQQSTSRETSITQSLKRLREESDGPIEDIKRSKVFMPKTRDTDVRERDEQTEEDSEQQVGEGQEKGVQQQTESMQELHNVKHTTQDINKIISEAESPKGLDKYDEAPEEDETSVNRNLAHTDQQQNRDDKEEDDTEGDVDNDEDAQDSSNEDAVIIVESNDEDEDEGNDEEEDEDAIEQQMDSYAQDADGDVDIYEDIDGEMGQRGFIDDQDDEMQATTDHNVDDDDVVIIDEDDDAVAMDSQEPESQAVSHSSLQTSQQILLPPLHPLLPPERQLSTGGRNQLTPFMLGGHSSAYEDFDDCTVPSTPTLHVPRRGDGFAEAVSSPQVVQRFVFGSGGEPNLGISGLSQLDASSVLGMGMDDTQMDLSQLEEGSGGSVPSTPSHSSGPEFLDKGTSQSDTADGQTKHDSAVEGESREVQYEDNGEGAETEEGDHEGEHGEDTYLEEYKATGNKSLHDTDKEQSGETGEVSQEDQAASSTSDKSQDAGGKPKIQKIVQADPSPVPTIGASGMSASQPIQTVIQGVTQQFHPVQGGSPRGRIHQSSSRGEFTRGQRRFLRGRGTMGGYTRRPPMY